MLQFAKKLETYHNDTPGVDKDLHGYNGPINVSTGTYGCASTQDDIIEGAKATGEKEIVDLQDFKSSNGISRWLRYICPRGTRQDTAHRYVHPLMASGKAPNLHLLVDSTVTRVIFEGKRAVGIEYRATAPITGEESKTSTVKAKLVVVSAGALGTPQILERSGVGSAEVLNKLDIPVVSDLPGVGEEYQDHHLIGYPYKTSLPPDQTLDALLGGRLDFADALKEKNPLMGWNGIDLAAKIRPTEEEVAQLGPEFKELWDRDFKNQTDRPLMLLAVVNFSLTDPATIIKEVGGPCQCITMGCYTAYPYSRGDIHITSKDPMAPPSFNTGFLSHPADVKKLLWAYKKQREIFRRTNCYDGEIAVGHPKFREGSRAALSDKRAADGRFTSLEDRRRLNPIEYDAEDDAAIEDWIRENMNTTWHSLGTCKMAPRENKGVVDKDLNVYGTEGLKLAGEYIARLLSLVKVLTCCRSVYLP